MSYRAAVHNLGCKVNSYELDVMVQELTAAGYEMVSFEAKADVYIVNTCSVTQIADRKSRQMLHRAKHLNPEALVVAAGCYVETDGGVLAEDPLVDLCVGNNRKGQIARLVQQAMEQRGRQKETAAAQAPDGSAAVRPGGAADKTLSGAALTNLTDHPAYENLQLVTPGRTRADVKIQDGCNLFCSYCIIPYARGRIRSRDPEDAVEEVKRLSASGTREIVLTGIHLSSFGREKGLDPAQELLRLLQRLQLIAGVRRLRLGSLEPRIMTEEFVSGLCRLSKVCPHFHLSLQSGCDATLRRMNRHYTAAQYLESVDLLRERYDAPAITTDIIVGFPGETPEDFGQTMEFVRAVNFYQVHVFRYSERKGTAAARLPDPCTAQEKARRSAQLLELTRAQARSYEDAFLGRPEELLLEEEVQLGGETYFSGHTMRYVEGLVPAQGHRAGEFVGGIFTRRLPGDGRLLLEEQQCDIGGKSSHSAPGPMIE